MVYQFIKSVLDEMGYDNAQDVPLAQLQDTGKPLFVYTSQKQAVTTYNMGNPVADIRQAFSIIGVTSDLYYSEAAEDAMGIKLQGIFDAMKARLPVTVSDDNGQHTIVDVLDPAIAFMGTDNKTLRITELSFTLLRTYRYGQ